MRQPSKYYWVMQHGFTLIELIIVMVVTGILAVGATTFIRNPTQSYLDSETYANLSDRADTALRRVARDVRNALPNSIRSASNGADTFVEFIPIKSAGRYRNDVGTSAADNPLDFSLSADTFDVLGPPVTVMAGDKMVIYNLGTAGADAYEGGNIRPLTTTGTLSVLGFNGGTFPLASPSSRFYTVAGAVTLACDMTNHQLLMYSAYAIQSTQPSALATLNGLATARQLAVNVNTCQINYSSGVTQRTGVITIYLGLNQNGAKVNLMHQINVVNSP
jgi:MSHA biogenesis protein MshO